MAKSTHPLLLRLAPWLLPVGTVIVWQLASSVGWLSTRGAALAGGGIESVLDPLGQR
ncbi:alkanesulfonate transporter permease subunit [Klebsiella pneumoniae]|uniref:Alkanesulfonate transporter permease subunit n=1 Tax=Klebsiella pneumoniae TaxID=573 RepID=A0A378F800_KLEPN|nr:alkanesulfonate transporter permease subunit [Klebsiella pneumoniae]